MPKKLVGTVALLLAIVALMALPVAAQAETETPAPHWYRGAHRVQEHEVLPLNSSSIFRYVITSYAGEWPLTWTVSCKLKLRGTLENPVGGGAGTNEITTFLASHCSSEPEVCVTGKPELIAGKLPWRSQLLPGSPIRDAIEGIELELRCSGSPLYTVTGTLMPTVNRRIEFGEGSGELENPSEHVKGCGCGTILRAHPISLFTTNTP